MSDFPTRTLGGSSDSRENQVSNEPEAPSDGSEILLRRLADMVANAKSMPLSASVLLARDELLELIDSALERLPEELRQARWMLRERDEYLGRAKREADQIIQAARARAEAMVQRTDIVREARFAAQKAVDDAEADASRLKSESEDYCDKRLAAFEISLDRIMKQVHAGRERLQLTPSVDQSADPAETAAHESFFDQDTD